jgi:hypothetical protein
MSAEPTTLSFDLVTRSREVQYQTAEGWRDEVSMDDLEADAAEMMKAAAEDVAKLAGVPIEAAGQAILTWLIEAHLAYRLNLFASRRAARGGKLPPPPDPDGAA